MTIILSPDFQKFMDRAGRIVERALSESVDIYMDYAGLLDSEDRGYSLIYFCFGCLIFFHVLCSRVLWSRSASEIRSVMGSA